MIAKFWCLRSEPPPPSALRPPPLLLSPQFTVNTRSLPKSDNDNHVSSLLNQLKRKARDWEESQLSGTESVKRSRCSRKWLLGLEQETNLVVRTNNGIVSLSPKVPKVNRRLIHTQTQMIHQQTRLRIFRRGLPLNLNLNKWPTMDCRA